MEVAGQTNPPAMRLIHADVFSDKACSFGDAGGVGRGIAAAKVFGVRQELCKAQHALIVKYLDLLGQGVTEDSIEVG